MEVTKTILNNQIFRQCPRSADDTELLCVFEELGVYRNQSPIYILDDTLKP